MPKCSKWLLGAGEKQGWFFCNFLIFFSEHYSFITLKKKKTSKKQQTIFKWVKYFIALFLENKVNLLFMSVDLNLVCAYHWPLKKKSAHPHTTLDCNTHQFSGGDMFPIPSWPYGSLGRILVKLTVSVELQGNLGTRQWENWILGSFVVIDRPLRRIFTKRIQNWNTASGCFSWSLR